jgi:tetratricopeptide (TPR) repeat protein
MTTSGGGAGRRSLWQLPLMLLAIGVFACAAWLFLDAKPTLTLNQKLAPAREFLRNDRPDAALESLSRLVASEKLPREGEAQVHLLVGEALDAQQKQRTEAGRGPKVESALVRLIEETNIALAQGIKPTGEIHRRLGESYEALGKPVEAVSQYRQAIAMDPPKGIRLQRKVIDLQLSTSDWAPAEASIDAYLGSATLTDAERAWAIGQKAQLLIDRGEAVDAKRMLEDAQRLAASDPIAQAEAKCQLGLCAWKLGNAADAEKLLQSARADFRGQHPMDASAAYVLGLIRQDKNDPAGAIPLLDVAINGKIDAESLSLAQLHRGECKAALGDDDAALADLKRGAEQARTASQPVKDQAVATLRKMSAGLAAKGNVPSAIELLLAEQSLDAKSPPSFYARLAGAYEKRAEQVEQSVADAPPTEQVRRQQLARDFRSKAADASVAYCRALAVTGDKNYGEPLWHAVDLYERAGNREAIATALELFVGERATDSIAPDALLKLARTYEAMSQPDKAIFAYERLQSDAYRASPSAMRGIVPLAALYLNKGPQFGGEAEKLLKRVVDAPASAAADVDARKSALFELAKLQHGWGKFADALPRFEQFVKEFPADDRAGEASFLAGECHARLAGQINGTVASATASTADAAADEMAKAVAAKKQHLAAAADNYDAAARFLQSPRGVGEADRKRHKLSLLRRADCAYELGNYDEAINLYQAAAPNDADTAQALAAQVQIANAYRMKNNAKLAQQANERAKSLLHKLPEGALQDGTIPLPKGYLEQWLNWSATHSAY